jgi:hypothetical protein
MRWRLRSVLVVLAVAACSGGSGDAEPAVLDVVAPAVGGGEIDLASYAGRELALWFWAPT